MANGDVTLGVAGIDLIYLRLSAILCAADRIMPPTGRQPRDGAPRPQTPEHAGEEESAKREGADAHRRSRSRPPRARVRGDAGHGRGAARA